MRDAGVDFPSDRDMLQALLRDSRLTPKERKAFEGMLRTAAGGKKLSSTQRSWVQDAFNKYELQSDKRDEIPPPAESGVRLPFENMPRPKKPPGQK